MATAQRTRPVTSLRILCETAQDIGIDPEVVLAGTDLGRDDLTDATREVTLQQELRAVANIVAVDPSGVGLGVTVGERMHVNSFGIWGFAVLTSPTFRAAIETAMDHIRLSLAIADIEFREDGDVEFPD